MGVGKLYRRAKMTLTVVMHYFDLFSDIAVTLQFYQCGDRGWFWLSLAFILAPCLIGALFEYQPARRLLALCQLLMLRDYLKGFGPGFPEGSEKSKIENAKLLEALVESMPQLMLQTYIIFFAGAIGSSKCKTTDTPLLRFSIAASLLSITAAVSMARQRREWGRLKRDDTGSEAYRQGFFGATLAVLLICAHTLGEAFLRASTLILFAVVAKQYFVLVLAADAALRFFVTIVFDALSAGMRCCSLRELALEVSHTLRNMVFVMDTSRLRYFFWLILHLECVGFVYYVYRIFDWRAHGWQLEANYIYVAAGMAVLYDGTLVAILLLVAYIRHRIDRSNRVQKLGVAPV